MSQAVRGFILQPTYRIEAGRPVVHLFGKLEDGQTFLVRDSRLTPHFWVRASEAKLAGELGARPLEAGDRTTMLAVLVHEVPEQVGGLFEEPV